jgi:hypothetical protein
MVGLKVDSQSFDLDAKSFIKKSQKQERKMNWKG